MKEWMEMVETVDDIIASNGIMAHNFQTKKGFQNASTVWLLIIGQMDELENPSKLKEFASLQVDFKKITSFNPPESITCPITDDEQFWDL